MSPTVINGAAIQIDPRLIQKYDRPGPRYTSYPTAPAWHSDFTAAMFCAAVEESNRGQRPLSLYCHLPFCETQCTFCGCNVVITKRTAITTPYMEALEREIAQLAQWVDPGRPVVQLHWGGGTPTYLSTAQLQQLAAIFRRHFTFAADAELGIEVDPRVTSTEQLSALRDAGFNRISLGVQDFTPVVQQAIHRIQSVEITAGLIAASRRLGYTSINVDLIYGLPHQTLERFAETLATVIRLQPDRIALYNFAFVPWLKPQQRQIDPSTLPTPDTKLALFLQGLTAFANAGYVFIGMDHFARPSDELARAVTSRTLWRNFQGYTTKAGTDLLGCGMTAISDVDGHYAQNVKTLAAYQRKIAEGMIPVERGMTLSNDDHLRRTIIRELLCNGYLATEMIATAYAIDFADYFQDALTALQPMCDDALATVTPEAITVTPLGRFFARNIAMAFDRYLTTDPASPPIYSRTI